MDPVDRQRAKERSAAGLLASGLILLMIGATVLVVAINWEFFKTAVPSQTGVPSEPGAAGDE
jgi:hypothetical protein